MVRGINEGVKYGLAKYSLRHLEKKAEQGDIQAQYDLALKYFVRQKWDKNHYWLKKAAEQGHADARYSLGNLYLTGNDVQEDIIKALEYMKNAAPRGNINA